MWLEIPSDVKPFRSISIHFALVSSEAWSVASSELRDDPELLELAMEQDVHAFEFASERLKAEMPLIAKAMQGDWLAVRHGVQPLFPEWQHDGPGDPVGNQWKSELRAGFWTVNTKKMGRSGSLKGFCFRLSHPYWTSITVADLDLELSAFRRAPAGRSAAGNGRDSRPGG